MISKKQGLVTTIFILVTSIQKKALAETKDLNLIYSIYHVLLFKNDMSKIEIQILIKLRNKINIKNLVYAVKQSF